MSDSDERPAKRLCSSIINTSAEPPEQTSSFLKLNDDCLHAIFVYLNIESLCHTANVCKRFGPITEQVFHRCHRKTALTGFHKNAVKRRIAYKFDHLVTHFEESSYGIKYDVIAKYCSKKLEHLHLYDSKISCNKIAPLASRLKYLSISRCRREKKKGDWNAVFENCPNLECFDFFSLDYESCEFLARHFPKLVRLVLDCENLLPDTLANILRLNPQLKYLDLRDVTNDEYINAIAEQATDLEELCIFSFQKRNIGLLQLSKLKKLKTLYISSHNCEKSMSKLMNEFSKEKIPLENCSIHFASISSDDINSLMNLKTVRVAELGKILQMTDANLLVLTSELPLLSKLILKFIQNSSAKFTVNGLIKMVQLGNSLTWFCLYGDFILKVTEDDYKSLLKAVQKRIEADQMYSLHINIACNSKIDFNVPRRILYANEKQLKFTVDRNSHESDETSYSDDDD
ncbi:uncharacterized protein LOC116342020 [Contarinia nasturtii]|uniref:uncharacterized protein LOC116342020 n=1 Tax=Contarinia nasturtii TaxID=265458 RepID=UPI0012D44E9F|nr:uncharacterized protein LOC116342020 [Contarinia nasturtii]XP_031625346.1 uncharacterized protein LOC116342020 [Contarinia nasturtii]